MKKSIMCVLIILLFMVCGCQHVTLTEADSITVNSSYFTSENGIKEKLINRINEEKWLYDFGSFRSENISDWFANYSSSSKYYYTQHIETYCLTEDEEIVKLTDNSYYCILYGDDKPLFLLQGNGGIVVDQNMGPYIIYDNIELNDSYFVYHTYEGLLCIVDNSGYYVADVWHTGQQIENKDIETIEYLRTIADFSDYDKYELDLKLNDYLVENMNYLYYDINLNSEDSKKAKQLVVSTLVSDKEFSNKNAYVGDEIINLQLIRGDENTSYITRVTQNSFEFPILVDDVPYGYIRISIKDGELDSYSFSYFNEDSAEFSAIKSKQRIIRFGNAILLADGSIIKSNGVEYPITVQAYDRIQQLFDYLKPNKLEKIKGK